MLYPQYHERDNNIGRVQSTYRYDGRAHEYYYHDRDHHHRDHNHDNNPDDGSNWELLCLYCHDNEHARYLDGESKGNTDASGKDSASVTHNPLAGLGALLKKGD